MPAVKLIFRLELEKIIYSVTACRKIWILHSIIVRPMVRIESVADSRILSHQHGTPMEAY
ncbi:MAG: hypothetical protein CSA25_01945 [Desulfobacter postgatei]|uniref:Uncharacterized protein n=1 Tax=Desulfobacter postgatei TaxID=2293 RepID=A0A2G6MSN2_9BACT|nr:MAG: hypothetical protein CSA25_01945 [Desulfobacter postgatei]